MHVLNKKSNMHIFYILFSPEFINLAYIFPWWPDIKCYTNQVYTISLNQSAVGLPAGISMASIL